MLILAEVVSFAVAPDTGEPLLILKATSSDLTLPLAVDPAEATSIAVKSLDIASEEPLTIDLVKAAVELLGGSIQKVIINDFDGQCYHASVHIAQANAVQIVSCRPSDAIALALRCDCPIFIDDEVFAKQQGANEGTKPAGLAGHVCGLDTMDFGRYFLK